MLHHLDVFIYTYIIRLDVFLLNVMTYDQFVAICHPLHHMAIMSPWLCGLLVVMAWIMSILNSLLQCLMAVLLHGLGNPSLFLGNQPDDQTWLSDIF